MARTYRRVVTGNDANGRSLVALDEQVEETGGAGNFNFWMTGARGGGEPVSFPFFPRSNETVFRVFRIPPDRPAVPADEIEKIAAGFFAELGDPSCKVDTTPPSAHASHSNHRLHHATGRQCRAPPR